MTQVIIAGHTFEAVPSFTKHNQERHITIAIPEDTSRSIILELQDATLMEITDRLGREIVGSYRLVGWRNLRTFFERNGDVKYLITWAIPNLDETDRIKSRIDEMTEESEDLTEALLDLASYDQTDTLLQQDEDLTEALLDLASYDRSEELQQQIEDLTDVILELASYISEIMPDEDDEQSPSEDEEYEPDPPELDPDYIPEEDTDEDENEAVSNDDNEDEEEIENEQNHGEQEATEYDFG